MATYTKGIRRGVGTPERDLRVLRRHVVDVECGRWLESMIKSQGPSLSTLVIPCQTELPGPGASPDGTLLMHETIKDKDSLVFLFNEKFGALSLSLSFWSRNLFNVFA